MMMMIKSLVQYIRRIAYQINLHYATKMKSPNDNADQMSSRVPRPLKATNVTFFVEWRRQQEQLSLEREQWLTQLWSH